MQLSRRTVRRIIAGAALAVVAGGCGGGDDDAIPARQSPGAAGAATGEELAGVRLDVRRDPG